MSQTTLVLSLTHAISTPVLHRVPRAHVYLSKLSALAGNIQTIVKKSAKYDKPILSSIIPETELGLPVQMRMALVGFPAPSGLGEQLLFHAPERPL